MGRDHYEISALLAVPNGIFGVNGACGELRGLGSERAINKSRNKKAHTRRAFQGVS